MRMSQGSLDHITFAHGLDQNAGLILRWSSMQGPVRLTRVKSETP